MCIDLCLLIYSEGILSFSSNWYELEWSSFTNFSALSCTFFNLKKSVQIYNVKGKILKLLKINIWKIISLLSLFKHVSKRFKIFSCWDAFLSAYVTNMNIKIKLISYVNAKMFDSWLTRKISTLYTYTWTFIKRLFNNCLNLNFFRVCLHFLKFWTIQYVAAWK